MKFFRTIVEQRDELKIGELRGRDVKTRALADEVLQVEELLLDLKTFFRANFT